MLPIKRVLDPKHTMAFLAPVIGLALILQPGEASMSTAVSTTEPVPVVLTQEIPSSPEAEPTSRARRRVRRRAQRSAAPTAQPPLRRRRGPHQLAWPVPHVITSRYGKRGPAFHHGIDVDCGLREKIRTSQRGRVSVVSHNKVYGWFVMVKHPRGVRTLYAHLGMPTVERGERIGPDSVVGYCGNSGMSTGSHLHFEVYVGRKTVNPLKVLPKNPRLLRR